MAKKQLTIEEKLEAALVPVEEQPYKVPDNWCWVRLDRIATIKRGASPRPIKKYITDNLHGENWIKIGDTGDGKYVSSCKERITQDGAEKSVRVEVGTLLLSNSMSFGRPYILQISGYIHDGWLAISPNKIAEKNFMYWALLASDWYFRLVATGTTVKNLNSARVAKTPIALPPFSEQSRIVTRIESLFAKLDEAKEKIQEVLDGADLRRAAILHQAFTGKLTEKWRREKGVSDDSWKETNLQNVCLTKITDGTHKTPKYTTKEEGGVPFISAKDVTQGEICWDNIKYIIPELHEELYA